MHRVPERRYFERISAQTEFMVWPLEKLYRILLILSEVNSSELCEYLALRGGTAINLCYEQLPRLSIDIDLVAIKNGDRDKMLTYRQMIRTRLTELLNSAGYQLDTHFAEYALDRFELNYRNVFDSPDRLKVEVNYVSARIPIYDPVLVKPVNLFEIDMEDVKTLSVPEVYGSKIETLFKRRAPRDVFDTYMLAKRKTIDLAPLKKCAIFSCCIEIPWDFRASLMKNPADAIEEKQAKQDLHPYLNRKVRFDLFDAKEVVGGFCRDLFRLDNDERQFLQKFFDDKRYVPNLLFPDKEHLGDHPGIVWRLRQLGRA